MLTIITDPNQLAAIATHYEVPSYVFGLTMLIVILVAHGISLSRTARRYNITSQEYLADGRYAAVMVLFYVCVLRMVISHIFEIIIWGCALFWMGLISPVSNAVLFAGSTYTTLGFYSDVLPTGWKMTIIMISFSGMFGFAWTTSTMMGMTKNFSIAQLQLHLRKHPESKAKIDKLMGN